MSSLEMEPQRAPAPAQAQAQAPDVGGGTSGGMMQDGGLRGNSFVQDQLNESKDKTPFTKKATGTSTTYTPKDGGNGKKLYFFFGYTGSKKDVKMRGQEESNLNDDILAGVANGFTVVYDTAGTKTSFLGAIYDKDTYGIYWSGHGGGGGIQTSDGGHVDPADIEKSKVGGNCQYLILAACQSGTKQAEWAKAMGTQCSFQGWVDLTNTMETNDFTSTALVGDSLWGHSGTDQSMELADYVRKAGETVKKDK